MFAGIKRWIIAAVKSRTAVKPRTEWKLEGLMRPKFATGSGVAPVHLAAIRVDSTEVRLDFLGDEVRQSIAIRPEELISVLQLLIGERVAFSVGCWGPAEQVEQLIESTKLQGPYVEIAWSGPDTWVVREMVDGATVWKRVDDVGQVANQEFVPTDQILGATGDSG